MIYIAILLLSTVSSIAYRAGGLDKDTKYWIPVWLRHSWVRDWLCPLCFGALFIPNLVASFSWFHLGMFLCYYGFCGISLSTYYDELFGYDNLWFSGFTVGMAGLFLWWAFPWYYLLARAILLAVIWGGLNVWINSHAIPHSDDIEEHLRGGILL